MLYLHLFDVEATCWINGNGDCRVLDDLQQPLIYLQLINKNEELKKLPRWTIINGSAAAVLSRRLSCNKDNKMKISPCKRFFIRIVLDEDKGHYKINSPIKIVQKIHVTISVDSFHCHTSNDVSL